MSICTPCLQALPIPRCTQEMVIGTIAEIDTAVSVYIRDVATSLVQRIDTDSDGAGLVTVNIAEYQFSTSHPYEIWVTEDGAGYKEKLQVTIGTNESDTICARFEDVKDLTGAQEMYTTQTLIEA